MDGVILYQSKYGATKKYADWISEETGFECIETKRSLFFVMVLPHLRKSSFI